MEISKLQDAYGRHPLVRRLTQVLQRDAVRRICVSGLQGSAAPLLFSSLAARSPQLLGVPFLFVLSDEEEAAYFYQDLMQVLGDANVLFFPSGFKRAVKYGQRDAASMVLRTEVLSRVSGGGLPLFVVTSPQALAELVIDRNALQGQTLEVAVGQTLDVMEVQKTLLRLGFSRVDYVYEPGQFSLRGSLLDVYSYSSEYPFRIDFFGDEVDSIRTFDVQDQLSLRKMERISIIPDSGSGDGATLQSFLSFLPADTLLITRDVAYVADCVRQIWTEGFSAQALVVEAAEKDAAQGAGAGSLVSDSKAEAPLVRERLLAEPDAFQRQLEQFRTIMLAASAPQSADVQLEAHTTAQPIFHKNFELPTWQSLFRALRPISTASLPRISALSSSPPSSSAALRGSTTIRR